MPRQAGFDLRQVQAQALAAVCLGQVAGESGFHVAHPNSIVHSAGAKLLFQVQAASCTSAQAFLKPFVSNGYVVFLLMTGLGAGARQDLANPNSCQQMPFARPPPLSSAPHRSVPTLLSYTATTNA